MMTTRRLDNIKAQLAAGAPDGETWAVGYEPCSCGEYCVHGIFPNSIEGPLNVHTSDRSIREICEFTEAAGQLVAQAPAIIRELLGEVDRQRSRAAGIERDAARRTYSFGVRYADQSAEQGGPQIKVALDAVLATADGLDEQARVLHEKADAMTDPEFIHRARSRADAYTRITGDLRRNITDALSQETAAD